MAFSRTVYHLEVNFVNFFPFRRITQFLLAKHYQYGQLHVGAEQSVYSNVDVNCSLCSEAWQRASWKLELPTFLCFRVAIFFFFFLFLFLELLDMRDRKSVV